MRTLILLLLIFSQCLSSLIIKDQNDLIKILKESNSDIKILHHNVDLRNSEIDKFYGGFHPNLNMSAQYSDDQLKPFINFQPQRTRNSHYSAGLSQKLMLGTELSFGFTNDRTKLYGFRSSSLNTVSVQQFNRPIVFAELSFDISKNLFGRIDHNNLNVLTLLASNEKHNLFNKEQLIYFQGISFLWNIRMIQEIVADVKNYLDRLEELEVNISMRISRKTAEPGELYSLKSTIAAKTAEILGLNRSIQNVNSSMKQLISTEEDINFQPSQSLDSVKKRIIDSENEILFLEFNNGEDSSLIRIAKNNTIIAAKQYNNAELDSLPDIKLFTRYAQTGTNTEVSKSYQELYKASNPQYSAGVNLTWPMSSYTYKAKRAIGRTKHNIASLNQNKLQTELKVKFLNFKNDINNLRYETDQIEKALESSIRLLDDLYIRYKQGRISLFELVIEEGKLLEIRIMHKSLWIARINSLIAFYSIYDLYKYNKKFV